MMKEKSGIVNLNNSYLLLRALRMVAKCTLVTVACRAFWLPEQGAMRRRREKPWRRVAQYLQTAIFQHRLDQRIVPAPVAIQRFEIAAVTARQDRLAETLTVFPG